MIGLLEFLAFSSLWVAAAAAALSAAAGRALGAPAGVETLLLAASGTLVVYILDRLRDVARDRETSPRRTRFVLRMGPALTGLAGAAAVAAGILVWRAGTAPLQVLIPVACLGLFHRRLKRFAWWKPFYVSGAWTAVVVGLPATAGASVSHWPWVAAICALTILANVIASNLRDGESPSARFGPGVPMRLARGLSVAALLLALFAPSQVAPLAMLPLATGAALLAFHPGELYGLIAVDGALLLGALASLVVA